MLQYTTSLLNPVCKSALLLSIAFDILVKAFLFAFSPLSVFICKFVKALLIQQPAWRLCQGETVLDLDTEEHKHQDY